MGWYTKHKVQIVRGTLGGGGGESIPTLDQVIVMDWIGYASIGG